jgi:hypothetical protein
VLRGTSNHESAPLVGIVGETADKVKEAVKGAAPGAAEGNQGIATLTGAFALLATIFTALGITGGVLGNMLRNHPVWAGIAVGLTLIAVLVGAVAFFMKDYKTLQRWLFLGGIILLAVAGSSAIVAALKVWGDETAPRVSASVEPSPRGDVIKVTAKTTGLDADGRVKLSVFPLDSEFVTSQTTPGQSSVTARYDFVSDARPLYQSITGPDGSGDVDLNPSIRLPPDHPPRVIVQAVVGNSAPEDCFSETSRSGCVIVDLGTTGRPQIMAGFKGGSLALRIAAVDALGASIHTRAFGQAGSRQQKLFAGELTSDAQGNLNYKTSVPIPSGASRVCVVSSLIPNQQCPPRQTLSGPELERCLGGLKKAEVTQVKSASDTDTGQAARLTSPAEKEQRCNANFAAAQRRSTSWERLLVP